MLAHVVWLGRFFADVWMLFPTEQEYIDVSGCWAVMERGAAWNIR
jgi:hypothetical protein